MMYRSTFRSAPRPRSSGAFYNRRPQAITCDNGAASDFTYLTLTSIVSEACGGGGGGAFAGGGLVPQKRHLVTRRSVCA